MTIKQIREAGHPAIADRALECQEEQGNEPNEDVDIWFHSGDGGFAWIDTKEGGYFWMYVHDGHFKKAYSIFPEYKPKDK